MALTFHDQPDFVWQEMLSYWQGTGQLDRRTSPPDASGLSEADFHELAYRASYGDPSGSVNPWTQGDGTPEWSDWGWTAGTWETAAWADDRDAGWRSEQGWHW